MNEYKIIIPKNKKGRKSEQQKKIYNTQLEDFSNSLIRIGRDIGMKVSSRGWCYLLEGYGLITKDQFNECQKIINKCRKKGYLPIDFIAFDKNRSFENIEKLTKEYQDPKDFIIDQISYLKFLYVYKKDVSFWESQRYYIQMAVEKIDVKNLFKKTCKKYHIPIANMKGWSDLNSRDDLISRYKEAEKIGLTPVLLYYGDFDPAGLLIADKLKKNLRDLQKSTNWNPKNLIIDRFGLKYNFIEHNNILWIDNLTSGGKRNIGKEYDKFKEGRKAIIYDYEIEYIEKYGKRKCEANAILPIRDVAIEHCEQTIQKYLGNNPAKNYDDKIKERRKEVQKIMEEINLTAKIQDIINEINNLDHE